MTSKIPTRHRAAGHREASAKLTAELASLDFPMRKEELAERVGDREVEVADGVTMPLGDMLERVRKREFRNVSQAVDAIEAQWQEYRAAAGAQEAPQPAMTKPGETPTTKE